MHFQYKVIFPECSENLEHSVKSKTVFQVRLIVSQSFCYAKIGALNKHNPPSQLLNIDVHYFFLIFDLLGSNLYLQLISEVHPIILLKDV